MYWIIKKEFLMRLRYKMRTINLYLYPFFMIAPYILISEQYKMEGNILMNMIMWEWMCQLLFGISDGIGELKIEGTFSNVVMSPCGLKGYLFFKYLFYIVDCIIITITTLILSYLFLDIYIEKPLLFILMCVVFSVSLFIFSLLFAGLVLRYKRIRNLNYFLQQIFGYLSGYTNNVFNFPIIVRFLSFLIPLTYAIIFFNKTYPTISIFGLLLIVTVVYLLIGDKLLNKEIINLRIRGDVDQW